MPDIPGYPNLHRVPRDPGGLLPGPDFTGSRDQLPGGPVTSWPAIPFPGTPALTPFEEVQRSVGFPPQGIDTLPNPGTEAGQAIYRRAYEDLPLGGPGTHMGAHPGLPASTVGDMFGDYIWEKRGPKLGGMPNLAPSSEAKSLGADLVAYEELMRLMMQNVPRAVGNMVAPIGPEMFPNVWPQNPSGYPTMPGGMPMPYDPSLPVGGGNVSPGAPGLPGHIPIPGPPPLPPQPYPGAPPGDWNPNSNVPGIGYPSGNLVPTQGLGPNYPLPPGVRYPRPGVAY